MSTRSLREQVVGLSASLFQRGFSVGSAGNVSVRLPGGGFVMTPTNSSLGRLDPDALAVLDEGWEHVEGPRPSKEVALHRAVYGARPDTGAVVHLHSTYVTALSCLADDAERVIPALTPYFVMRVGGEVPVVPYFRPGSDEAVDALARAAAASPAVILANHGSIVAGKSVEDAVNAAEELEESARLAFVLRDRAVRPLSDEAVAALLS